MADKKAPEETEEKTQAKEHDVSIVLSYMDDEHEKAAIEVREMPPAPPAPVDESASGFSFLTLIWILIRRLRRRRPRPR